jgi:hypothetical protein
LIRRSLCKRGNRSRVQGDKARNGRTGCQTCSAGLECGDASPLSKADVSAHSKSNAISFNPRFERQQFDLLSTTDRP